MTALIWTDRKPEPAPRVPLTLVAEAAAANPSSPELRLRLAEALLAAGDAPAAANAYAEAERLDPERFDQWGPHAEALLRSDDAEAALARCDTALEKGAPEALRHTRGLALRALGRREEAHRDFARSLEAPPVRFDALHALLEPIAAAHDGARLMETVAALPEAYRHCAGARAYRALAHSLLGEDEAARTLVDLDRHVRILRFEPSPEFGGLAAFNRALADEILADPPPARRNPGFAINYLPRRRDSAAHAALSAFVRAAIEDYVGDFAAMGLAGVMPALTGHASLGRTTVVLRGRGTNGEHIHAGNDVSTVYYVQVPARGSDDDRGALLLGSCERTARGHRAAWGTRAIRPEPGMLAIFPSHVFHDVIPTLSDEPRIVVAGDMRIERGVQLP